MSLEEVRKISEGKETESWDELTTKTKIVALPEIPTYEEIKKNNKKVRIELININNQILRFSADKNQIFLQVNNTLNQHTISKTNFSKDIEILEFTKDNYIKAVHMFVELWKEH